MSQDMLGVVADIVTKLRNGSISIDEAKRFARREDPFVPKSVGAFNPQAFMGTGWHTVDKCKTLPTGWSPKLLVGFSALEPDEKSIYGHVWRQRLSGKPLLGVEAFWLCWNNLGLIPAEFKSKKILFDGDALRSRPTGLPASLSLSWSHDRWKYDVSWHDHSRFRNYVSAVMAD